MSPFLNRCVAIALLLLASLSTGCGGGSNGEQAPESGFGEDDLRVQVQVPDFLNAANINNLNAQWRYGSATFELQDRGTFFFADIDTGVRDPSVGWQLEYYEIYQGQALVLIETGEHTLPASATTLSVAPEQFAHPDDDLDGDSNLAERNANSQPFDSLSTVGNPQGHSGSAQATLVIDVNVDGLVNVDDAALLLTASVDGQLVVLRSLGGPLVRGAVNFSTANVSHDVSIEVSFNGREPLASWTGSVVTPPGTTTLSVLAEDFIDNLDSDADGLTNIQELGLSLTTSVLVDVAPIDRIAPSLDAPVIDAVLDEPIWRLKMAGSPVSEAGEGGLWIDKLLETTPANSLNSGDPSHEWAAVHDGERLYLAVRVIDEHIVVDSAAQIWHDDSVELYLDVDHGRLASYDGVDDYHLIFSLSANGDGGTVAVGQHSAPLPAGIVYALGSGGFADGIDTGWSAGGDNLPAVSSGYLLELSLPLAELGLAGDQVFGLDLHINDDDNGGARDAKWNWAWSRQLDDHWRDPRLFGAARLE